MAEPIRVLELLVSSDLGGGPAHVRDLVAHLPRDEFAITVAAPGGGPYVEMFRSLGVEFVEVAADRLSPRTLYRVVRLVRRRDIRLIHSHGKGAGLYGRLAARRARIPAIHTFHGIHYEKYPPGLRWVYLALERWLAGMTHTVIHVSESQRKAAEELGLAPRGRARVIINGVDVPRIRRLAEEKPVTRQQLGLPPDALVVGTVARLDPVKGLDVLVESFVQIKERVPQARLLIIGEGPEATRLQAQVRELGIKDRVVFQSVPDASRSMPAMDVYVSASRSEGLPLSVLEAMACGVAVVATEVPGHLDVVEKDKTGRLVPRDQPAALADAAAGLLTAPEVRDEMGQAARRQVEERFSASRMGAEVAAVYRTATGRFPRGAPDPAGV